MLPFILDIIAYPIMHIINISWGCNPIMLILVQQYTTIPGMILLEWGDWVQLQDHQVWLLYLQLLHEHVTLTSKLEDGPRICQRS